MYNANANTALNVTQVSREKVAFKKLFSLVFFFFFFLTPVGKKKIQLYSHNTTTTFSCFLFFPPSIFLVPVCPLTCLPCTKTLVILGARLSTSLVNRLAARRTTDLVGEKTLDVRQNNTTSNMSSIYGSHVLSSRTREHHKPNQQGAEMKGDNCDAIFKNRSEIFENDYENLPLLELLFVLLSFFLRSVTTKSLGSFLKLPVKLLDRSTINIGNVTLVPHQFTPSE